MLGRGSSSSGVSFRIASSMTKDSTAAGPQTYRPLSRLPGLATASGSPHEPHDERDHEDHQEEHEEELRDPRRARGDAAEPEDGGDQRDDQEDQGPSQHVAFLRLPAGGAGR